MRRRALAGSLLAALTRPAAAEDDTAMEIGLWKAVTARGLKSDYEDYLRFFPSGRFAPLAQVRLAQLDKGAPPAAPPGSPAAPPGDFNLYHLDVAPSVAARGQQVTVRCRSFGPPALYDTVVVVGIGAPDTGPDGGLDQRQVIFQRLAATYDLEREGIELVMLPAGAYEVRYMSRQYNPQGRMEVMARAGLTVR